MQNNAEKLKTYFAEIHAQKVNQHDHDYHFDVQLL